MDLTSTGDSVLEGGLCGVAARCTHTVEGLGAVPAPPIVIIRGHTPTVEGLGAVPIPPVLIVGEVRALTVKVTEDVRAAAERARVGKFL